MSKRDDSLEIIASLGLPRAQRNERSGLTLLALAGLTEDEPWANVRRPLLRIVDIMAWMREHYGKNYAPNSRETIRRQTIHQFEQARLVDRNPDDPSRATNSGDTVYQLTADAAKVLKAYGKKGFPGACKRFLASHGALSDAYERQRNLVMVPVTLPGGSKIVLSPGAHNELQRLIVEEFGPRFCPGAALLYLGDTAEKRLVIEARQLNKLNIPELNHDKLPDVVLYDAKRKWLFLVEAVTTHGPVSPKRHAELEAALKSCTVGRIYVTAFMNFTAFKKHASNIVWESEAWIADAPDHMIHFNGNRFLGPYPRRD